MIAHSVSVMTVQAGAVRRTLQPDQRQQREVLEHVEATGRQALTELRRLLGLLREADAEPALAPQPGLGQLPALVGHVREAGLPVRLDVMGRPTPLPPGIDLSAYRIVQEALTNVLKHAASAPTRVVVSYGADDLRLEVRDEGALLAGGGGPRAPGTGHGVVGMRERVEMYGGDLEAGPHDDGYVVRARLPLR